METFNISIDFEDLKCNICKNFLSVPPIIYTDSTGIICGRCNHLAYKQKTNPVIERQTLFEILAENIEFPCINKERGCEAMLKWGDVSEHETSCEKKVENIDAAIEFVVEEIEDVHDDDDETVYSCFPKFVRIGCKWGGILKEVKAHVNVSHSQSFVDPPYIALSKPYVSEFIFHEFSGIFVYIAFEYDKTSNAYYCLVYTEPTNQKRLMYEIKVLNGKRKEFICFPKLYSVNLPLYDEKTRKFGQAIKMSDISSIQEPKYIFIEFIPGDSKTLPIIEVDNGSSIPICTKCNMYLTPPVYFCHENHKFCEDCVTKNSDCNRVKRRNLLSEQMLCYSQYTCVNLRCSFVGTFSTYRLHKNICSFKAKKCPIEKCHWIRYDLMFHVKKCHEISETNVYIPLLRKHQSLLFVFDAHVFSLKIDHQFTSGHGTIVKFKLICVGVVDLNYKYEIEIHSPDHPHSKIVFEQLVEPELYRFVNIGNKEFTTSEVLNQLFPLNSKLEFKLNITAIDKSNISKLST